MKKVSPYESIPKNHANRVVDMYLQLKWQQWKKQTLHLEHKENDFDPWILDLPEADINEIAGKPPLGRCVFGTVHDALVY